MNSLKVFLVASFAFLLAACGSNNTPRCPTNTGYSQTQYQQPMSNTQHYQEPVSTSSSRIGDLATGAAVGATVGHLATKKSNSNQPVSSLTSKTNKSMPTTNYKKPVVSKSKPKPIKKKVSLSKSKSFKSSSSKRR